jgi:hypothetical protein
VSRISRAVELIPSSLVGVVDLDDEGVGAFETPILESIPPRFVNLLLKRCEAAFSYGEADNNRFRRRDEFPPNINGPRKTNDIFFP